MTHPAALDPFVESKIEAFESALAMGSDSRVESYLPPLNHAKYLSVASELVRVDMDLAWSRGERRMLADFEPRFPELFASLAFREELAFEEFRLRRQAGDEVTPEEYASRMNINTESWSSWSGYDELDSAENRRRTTGERSTCARNGSTAADFPVDVPIGTLQPGDRWNGFEIVRSLGKGSFGQAYLATQDILAGREVVLKFSGFESTEAEKVAKLQHTNITPVFSVHRSTSGSVMCMPYLGQATLADVIAELKEPEDFPSSGQFLVEGLSTWTGLSEATAQEGEAKRFFTRRSYTDSVLWIVSRLADGLQHSHERGILHRDVKPANLLLRDDGEPLLIDFNLATDEQASSGEIAGGTLPYMAPEQIRAYQSGVSDNGELADPRSDVYSLGVCLYELLTGRVPFPATERQGYRIAPEVLENRRKRPDRLDSSRIGVTPAVQSIVDHCLAFDRNKRYQSAAHLRDDLLHHLDDRPLHYAKNESVRERTVKWMRRNPRLFSYSSAAAVMVVAMLVMMGAWLVRERQVAGTRATNTLNEFQSQLDEMRPAMAAIGLQAVDAKKVTAEAEELAQSMHVRDGRDNLSQHPHWKYLTAAQQDQWSQSVRTLSFLLARSKAHIADRSENGATQKRRFEEALAWSQVAEDWSLGANGLSDVVAIQRQRIERAMRPTQDGSHAATSQFEAPTEAISETETETESETESGSALSEGGDDPLSYLLIGLERCADNDLPGATRAFRRATELSPQDPAGWLRLAEALRRQHHYERALACFDVCMTLLPDAEFVHFHRGLCFLQNGQVQEASDDFTRAIELQPELEVAYLNRALARIQAGEQQEALADLTRVIENGPKYSRTYFIRARLLRNMGQERASLSDRQRGMAQQPSDALDWIARGVARIATEPKKALEDFQQGLKVQPRSSAALHNMAHVFSEKLEDTDAALQALDRSLEIDESDTLALAGRGVLLARLGRKEPALADARTLLNSVIDPITRYQVACILALVSESDPSLAREAIGVFLESIVEDLSLLDIVEGDPDLENIRDLTDFQTGLAAVRSLRELTQTTSKRHVR